MRGRKTNEVSSIIESATLAAIDEVMKRVIQSEGQSAKWRIRELKTPFRYLHF